MEKMMMMMMVRSPENPSYETNSEVPITATTCPSWKLYENPFYHSQHQQPQQQKQKQTRNKHLHHRLQQLPLSARKIAASFWDLTFFRPIMDAELEMARAQITELKAELEFERKARKKVESMNKRLTKELNEERRGREAMEKVCEELAKEISSDKAISWMKREIEEERKMLRMAEVLREERVQMKLADAKLLLEEKLLELEVIKKQTQVERSASKIEQKNQAPAFSSEKPTYNDMNAILPSMTIQRRASPEIENPHIKRGIKGFVEFPKVVRAIGSRSRHLGTKLECQKAQLRILLKQRNPIRSDSLIMS